MLIKLVVRIWRKIRYPKLKSLELDKEERRTGGGRDNNKNSDVYASQVGNESFKNQMRVDLNALIVRYEL